MSTLHPVFAPVAGGRRADRALPSARRLRRLDRMLRAALASAVLASASGALAAEEPAPAPAEEPAFQIEAAPRPGEMAMGTGGMARDPEQSSPAMAAPGPEYRGDRKVDSDPYDRTADSAG